MDTSVIGSVLLSNIDVFLVVIFLKIVNAIKIALVRQIRRPVRLKTNGSNILVVSYDNDWQHCLVLLKSIDTYFKNCNIIIVDSTFVPCITPPKLNYNNVQVVPWTSLIKEFKSCKIDSKGIGWIHQQVLKFAAHKLFNDKYVILDSDCVIIKYFKFWLEDSFRTRQHLTTFFPGFASYCAEYLKIDNIKKVRPAQVPVIMDPKQVKALLDSWKSIDDFQTWFCNSPVLPSEYILYDVWMQRYKIRWIRDPTWQDIKFDFASSIELLFDYKLLFRLAGYSIFE
jgi:hypothetical protein